MNKQQINISKANVEHLVFHTRVFLVVKQGCFFGFSNEGIRFLMTAPALD